MASVCYDPCLNINFLVKKLSRRHFDDIHVIQLYNYEKVPREYHFLKIFEEERIGPVVYDYEFDLAYRNMVVSMEYLSAPEWSDISHLNKIYLSEETMRLIMYQLFGIIQTLNSQDIYHMDIKPRNIMVNTSSYETKLIDFEDVFYESEREDFEYVGTPGYKSIERYLKYQYHDLKRAQVFSLGCVLYFLKTSHHYISEHSIYTKKSIMLFHGLENVSDSMNDFLGQCLEWHWQYRPDFEAIMSHEWLVTPQY